MTAGDDFEAHRTGHLTRTAALWRRLVELGASNETPIDFDFSFTATSKVAADALYAVLADYSLIVEARGLFNETYTLTGTTGAITWTEERLLKWVDYLLAVAKATGCEFDGCGASAPQGAT